jgi:hypothetical protein
MVFQKNHRSIIWMTGLLLMALSFPSCKKLKTKDPIVFSITAVMPHDGSPVAGVKYKIVEYKYKTKFGKVVGDQTPTGWELTGFTDSQGKASGSFKGVLKTNYSYTIYFDYNGLVLPSGITEFAVKGPEYDILNRSSPEDNNYEVRVLPFTSMHFKVENVNCFDGNDKMRFKARNIDENPYDGFEQAPYGLYFNGCGSHTDYMNNHILAGHQVYQIEVTRNGITSTDIDTFNLLPNTVNEVFIEY